MMQAKYTYDSTPYYRARYYDPNIGMFITEDPIRGMSGSVNFYTYVANGPLSWIDPSGLCFCDAAKSLRLVPISDCSSRGGRRIVYVLTGAGASNWWVTEHQNPPGWAPAARGSAPGQSTGNEADDAGGFDDTIFGWGTGNSIQTFTVSLQDPRKSPDTESCPVVVQLPSGPNGQPQDFGALGIWHGGTGGMYFINGNSTGWVPCNSNYSQH